MAKRRRIRWDRITITTVILVVLIFLLGSCVHSCRAGRQDESSADPAVSKAESSAAQTPGSSAAEESSTGQSAAEAPSDYDYVTMMEGAMHAGKLVLVNSENPCTLTKDELDLEQVYFSQDRPEYEVSYSGHTTFNRTALAEFNRLMRAYIAETGNTEIMFNYGYLEAGKEKSNPESATGLDIQLHLKYADGGYSYISNISPYSWLFSHMAEYGYILRYPDNKTDLTGERGTYTAIRYVGLPHAKYIAENDLCLEEYLSMLRDKYTFGKGMLCYATDTDTYQIYYVPADTTGDTTVPVPKSGMWEISGNNIDGFIVTTYGG